MFKRRAIINKGILRKCDINDESNQSDMKDDVSQPEEKSEEFSIDIIARIKQEQSLRKIVHGIQMSTEYSITVDKSNSKTIKKDILSVDDKFHSNSIHTNPMDIVQRNLMENYITNKLGTTAEVKEKVITAEDALYIIPNDLRVESETNKKSTNSRLAWSTGIAEISLSSNRIDSSSSFKSEVIKPTPTQSAPNSLAAFRFGIFGNKSRDARPAIMESSAKAVSHDKGVSREKLAEDNWGLEQLKKRHRG